MVLTLGAINKKTKKYVYPQIANKNNTYICSDCNKTLIFCHGKIIKPYFRHKTDHNSCTYYDKPNEAQIHKDAKMLLKKLLETQDLIISRKCTKCKKYDKYDIKQQPDSNIEIEYRFQYGEDNKIADVAYIWGTTIHYLFEIYNTHKTNEGDRPDPWFEICAKSIIKYANDDNKLFCSRNIVCRTCNNEDGYKEMYGKICWGEGSCLINKPYIYDFNSYCLYKCTLCINCNDPQLNCICSSYVKLQKEDSTSDDSSSDDSS